MTKIQCKVLETLVPLLGEELNILTYFGIPKTEPIVMLFFNSKTHGQDSIQSFR